MNEQQEYELFIAKLAKARSDIQKDLAELSPENQRRFAKEANDFLKRYGYAITIDDLLRKRF